MIAPRPSWRTCLFLLVLCLLTAYVLCVLGSVSPLVFVALLLTVAALHRAAQDSLQGHLARVDRPTLTRCPCTEGGTQRPVSACPHCREEGWLL